MASAAALSIAAARLLDLPYPLFACVAAVVATDLAPAVSRRVGSIRIATSLVGAACAIPLALLPAPQALTVGTGILICMLACQLLNLADGAKVAACVCTIIILMHGGEVWSFSVHRVIETAIGVAAAWIVSYIPKLMRVEEISEGTKDE